MSAPRRFRLGWHRTAPGQAIVEAAVTLPIYLLLTMGVLEGAMLVFSIGVLGHSVQEGGRRASVPGATVSSIQQRVLNTGAGWRLTIPTGNVQVTVAGRANYDARQAGDRVKVVATYTYRPFVGQFILDGTSFTLRREVDTMVE